MKCADWCAVEILLKIERREEWKERKEEKRKKDYVSEQ